MKYDAPMWRLQVKHSGSSPKLLADVQNASNQVFVTMDQTRRWQDRPCRL